MHLILLTRDALFGRVIADYMAVVAPQARVDVAFEVAESPDVVPVVDVDTVDDVAVEPALYLSSDADVVAARTHGLCKPFRLEQFAAEVQRVFAELHKDVELGDSGYVLRPSERVLLSARGATLALTEKEAQLLVCLADSGGAVTRDALLAQVWGYGNNINTHTLETHIYRLRQKLAKFCGDAVAIFSGEEGYSISIFIR